MVSAERLTTSYEGKPRAIRFLLQVFYISHIIGFLLFMTFAFIHYQSMWAYTTPGTCTQTDADSVIEFKFGIHLAFLVFNDVVDQSVL